LTGEPTAGPADADDGVVASVLAVGLCCETPGGEDGAVGTGFTTGCEGCPLAGPPGEVGPLGGIEPLAYAIETN